MSINNDNDPSYDDIAKMPYLEATTWEVLRLAAAGPSTNRKALVDVEVLGHVWVFRCTCSNRSALINSTSLQVPGWHHILLPDANVWADACSGKGSIYFKYGGRQA